MSRNNIGKGALWVSAGDVMRAVMRTVALVLGAFLSLLLRLAARIFPFYVEPSVASVSLSMSKGCLPSSVTRSAKKISPSKSSGIQSWCRFNALGQLNLLLVIPALRLRSG
jgi:hypothetical protein